MNENNLKHIQENKLIYRTFWFFGFISWLYLTYNSLRFVGYVWFIKNPELIMILWLMDIILTMVLVWTAVWIFWIDMILGPEATNKRKSRGK